MARVAETGRERYHSLPFSYGVDHPKTVNSSPPEDAENIGYYAKFPQVGKSILVFLFVRTFSRKSILKPLVGYLFPKPLIEYLHSVEEC